MVLAGCGGGAATRAPATAPAMKIPSPAVVASAPPNVTACRVQPSTVYGDEAVVLEIIGVQSAAPVQVEVRDAAGRSVARGTTAVPGTWQVPALPSGDFSLHVADASVTCLVTVNRELSRASSISR